MNPALSRPLRVVIVDQPDVWDEVANLRERVFEIEQGMTGVPIRDQDDHRSLTLAAYLGEEMVATGRLSPPFGNGDAFIAWVATDRRYRRMGFAGSLVGHLLEASDHAGYRRVRLSSQIPAVSLYERFGFVCTGEVFTVRGIKHRTMIRRLPEEPLGLR